MKPNFFSRWLARTYLRHVAIPLILSRDPDVILRPGGEPYMLRWHVIPRNKWFNIYLHVYEGSDKSRALHDHPWWNVSFVLAGPLLEETPTGLSLLSTGSLTFRRATSPHRISIPVGGPGPVTLFITGPVSRVWGFYCKDGWRPFTQITTKTKIDGQPTSISNPHEDC